MKVSSLVAIRNGYVNSNVAKRARKRGVASKHPLLCNWPRPYILSAWKEYLRQRLLESPACNPKDFPVSKTSIFEHQGFETHFSPEEENSLTRWDSPSRQASQAWQIIFRRNSTASIDWPIFSAVAHYAYKNMLPFQNKTYRDTFKLRCESSVNIQLSKPVKTIFKLRSTD